MSSNLITSRKEFLIVRKNSGFSRYTNLFAINRRGKVIYDITYHRSSNNSSIRSYNYEGAYITYQVSDIVAEADTIEEVRDLTFVEVL